MIAVDAKDITFNTDNSYNSIKVEIDPKYKEYIKQLEEEVIILREIATSYKKEIQKMLDDEYSYSWDQWNDDGRLSKIPPQTPEWRS